MATTSLSSILSTFLTDSPTLLLVLTTIMASVFATSVLLSFEGNPEMYTYVICIVLIQVRLIRKKSQSRVQIDNPVH